MFRQANLLSFLLLFVALFALPSASVVAQELGRDELRVEFNKGFAIEDDRTMDKAIKRGARETLKYYEELCFDKDKGDENAARKMSAMEASWKRLFEGGDTLDKVQRWANGMSASEYEKVQKVRRQADTLHRYFLDDVLKNRVHDDYTKLVAQFVELARASELLGHYGDAAEMWGLASVVGSKVPDPTLEDRREVVFALEQFLESRRAWNFTFDEHFIRNGEYLKGQKVAIEEAAKKDEKRAGEGYDANAKGVDSLVMPNSVEEKHEFKFESLATWEELDYGPKNSPLPAFWWMSSLGGADTNNELTWFRRTKLYLWRTGANKFAISHSATDAKENAADVDVSPKAKPSTFWLDSEKKVPYSMFFWIGSDRELVNEAECNMASSDKVANVYYRSAASWKVTVGAETLLLYDDNANGNPGDSDPYEPTLKMPILGDHDSEGSPVPMLDSMRLGKGPRVPYSEFVKLGTGWFHMKKGATDYVGLRPLNPEYVKTGKIKLQWTGPKPTAPVQLVVQGSGDYKTAFFDVAGGKEVEVPAGDYTVIWGRLVSGKGARAQMASIYQGGAKPFTVAADSVFTLKMGGPFQLEFTRRGDATATIDALKILVRESSGCLFTQLHNISLACDVMAAKSDDGKGAKAYGKFVRFTDPELVNKSASKHNNLGLLTACWPMPDGYREGELVLTVKLPADGMKLGLAIKKHPLFGALTSAWQ